MGFYSNVNQCHKSHIMLSGEAKCRGEQCHECSYCGWNPEVNRRRRNILRGKAASGQLA